MTFANLEKYVHSKKCLKQSRQPLPPPQKKPSFKVEGILVRKLKVTWLRLLFASEFAYPADRVITKRSVYRTGSSLSLAVHE